MSLDYEVFNDENGDIEVAFLPEEIADRFGIPQKALTDDLSVLQIACLNSDFNHIGDSACLYAVKYTPATGDVITAIVHVDGNEPEYIIGFAIID